MNILFQVYSGAALMYQAPDNNSLRDLGRANSCFNAMANMGWIDC